MKRFHVQSIQQIVLPGLIGAFLGTTIGCTTLSSTSAPTISSFTPTQTLVGNTVAITGAYFSGATALTINGVPITSFNVDSDTQITAMIPPAASTGFLTVTTPEGTATSTAAFSVLPAITSLSRTTGSTGSSVILAGSGFVGTTRVTFGAQSTTAYGAVYTVDSANQITATVPSDAITGAVYLTSSSSTCTGPIFTVQ